MQVMRHLVLITSLMLFLATAAGLGWGGCQAQREPSRKEMLMQAEKDLQRGNYHRALTTLSRLMKDDPHNAQLHLDMAWVYLYTNQTEKAIQEVQRVQEQEPQNKGIYHIRGAIYQALGEHVDALDDYNTALKYDINNPDLHGRVAEVFMALNEPEAALREYDVALRLQPEAGKYEFGRCMAYRRLQQNDKAIAACENALQLTPAEAEKAQIQEVIENMKLLDALQDEKPASEEKVEATPPRSETR